MNASLFKFYNDNKYSPQTAISTSLISVVISSCFFSGLLVLFSPFLNSAINSFVPVNWFLWIALILLFDAVSARVFVVLRVQERPFYFLFISVVQSPDVVCVSP